MKNIMQILFYFINYILGVNYNVESYTTKCYFEYSVTYCCTFCCIFRTISLVISIIKIRGIFVKR